MAWEYSKIDREVTTRWKKMGDFGEYVAEKLLSEHGFTQIKNLNKERHNNIFADIYAIKDRKPYVISVKARNKYENNGRLNSRYKLGKNCYEKAPILEREYKAAAAWISIAVDIGNKTFDAYFGLLSSLGGNTGIPMTQEAIKAYQCLASCRALEDTGIKEEEYMQLKNLYKSK